VSRVDYALRKDAPANFVYADVARYFAARNVARPRWPRFATPCAPSARRRACCWCPAMRIAAVPAASSRTRSCRYRKLDSLAQELGIEKQSIPAYPAQDGEVKLSAAWLIERAGFAKGYALGNAGISSRHTLALINRGGASAAEVTALRDQVIEAVASRFAIRLEPEPVWLAQGGLHLRGLAFVDSFLKRSQPGRKPRGRGFTLF
jgi:UDP-N-acetylmuramate dehydrogenase